jgi:hypothetical protein
VFARHAECCEEGNESLLRKLNGLTRAIAVVESSTGDSEGQDPVHRRPRGRRREGTPLMANTVPWMTSPEAGSCRFWLSPPSATGRTLAGPCSGLPATAPLHAPSRKMTGSKNSPKHSRPHFHIRPHVNPFMTKPHPHPQSQPSKKSLHTSKQSPSSNHGTHFGPPQRCV